MVSLTPDNLDDAVALGVIPVIGSTSLVTDGRAPVKASAGKSAVKIPRSELKPDKAVENEISVSVVTSSSSASASASTSSVSSSISVSSVGAEVTVAVADADVEVADALHQPVEEGDDDDDRISKERLAAAPDREVAFKVLAAKSEDTVV